MFKETNSLEDTRDTYFNVFTSLLLLGVLLLINFGGTDFIITSIAFYTILVGLDLPKKLNNFISTRSLRHIKPTGIIFTMYRRDYSLFVYTGNENDTNNLVWNLGDMIVVNRSVLPDDSIDLMLARQQIHKLENGVLSATRFVSGLIIAAGSVVGSMSVEISAMNGKSTLTQMLLFILCYAVAYLVVIIENHEFTKVCEGINDHTLVNQGLGSELLESINYSIAMDAPFASEEPFLGMCICRKHIPINKRIEDIGYAKSAYDLRGEEEYS